MQGKHLTYRELDERANQLARFLEANGVQPEQPVGVMLERSLELMVAMMAVLKAGGAFVPMDPEYPADRLALMAEDAEVFACLVTLTQQGLENSGWSMHRSRLQYAFRELK